MNKKGSMGQLYMEDWAELYTLLLLIIGFIIGMIIQNDLLSGLVGAAGGVIAGKAICGRRKKFIFPHFLITIGFLLGFMLGSFKSNRFLILVLFIAGGIAGYLIELKKLVETKK